MPSPLCHPNTLFPPYTQWASLSIFYEPGRWGRLEGDSTNGQFDTNPFFPSKKGNWPKYNFFQFAIIGKLYAREGQFWERRKSEETLSLSLALALSPFPTRFFSQRDNASVSTSEKKEKKVVSLPFGGIEVSGGVGEWGLIYVAFVSRGALGGVIQLRRWGRAAKNYRDFLKDFFWAFAGNFDSSLFHFCDPGPKKSVVGLVSRLSRARWQRVSPWVSLYKDNRRIGICPILKDFLYQKTIFLYVFR